MNLNVFAQFAPKVAEVMRGNDCVIYTRVSDSKQEDNTSLESQDKYCTICADTNKLNIAARFGGKHESAKTDERKEFQKMLLYVKKHKNVRFIIVNHYDRFSRSGANGIQIAEQLQKNYGVLVLSASQGIDPTTIMGQFVRNMLLMVGNMENMGRIERTTTAMKELLLKGYTPYSIPKGYINLNKGSRAVDQKIVLNEEGKIIHKAFILKAEKGMRNSEIVKLLKPMGLKIDERRLCEVFANPYYCGILVSKFFPGKAVEGKHEAMVSKEIFLKVNNIVADGRKHPVSYKEQDENLPLKRFAHCSECGTPLTGFLVRKKNIWYYKCRKAGCSATTNAKHLHNHFRTLISAFQINESEAELIKIGITEMYGAFFHEKSENAQILKAKISEVAKKLDKAKENLVTGVIDRELYDEYSAKFKKEISENEAQLVKMQNGSSNLQSCLQKVVQFCLKPLVWWESANVGDKMNLQNMLFPEGIIYDRKNDRVQTNRVNSYFSPIPQLVSVLRGNENGESTTFSTFSVRVTSPGF